MSLAEARAALGVRRRDLASEDGDEHHFDLELAPDSTLGEPVNALTSWGIDVISCTEEQPKIEQAFISLTPDDEEAGD